MKKVIDLKNKRAEKGLLDCEEITINGLKCKLLDYNIVKIQEHINSMNKGYLYEQEYLDEIESGNIEEFNYFDQSRMGIPVIGITF